VLADVRIAARNAEISSLELERRVEDILVVVANAYWDLLYARKDLEVKEQGLLEATDLLDINRRKLQVGSGTEIDVIDAEANIETQKAGIIDARNALDNAQDSLLDQINAPDYRLGRDNPLFIDVEIVPTTEPAFEDLELSLADSVDTALDERVELRQSRLTIENAEDLYDRASNDLLPSLDLIGSWTNSGLEDGFSGTWRELSGGTYYDWSVGLVFEIPIGNRAARERRSQADIDRSSAQLDRERTVNSIVLGVTQAVRNVRSAQQRVLTTRAATRLRSEQLDSEKRTPRTRSLDQLSGVTNSKRFIRSSDHGSGVSGIAAESDHRISKADWRSLGDFRDRVELETICLRAVDLKSERTGRPHRVRGFPSQFGAVQSFS